MKVKNFKLLSHMSMENQGVLVQCGTIELLGHELHCKTIIKTTITPKLSEFEYGKPKIYYQVQGDEKEFKGIKNFCKYYKIELPKQK